MSIKARRDSVLKSSLSLNSIRDSVTNFGKGIGQSISTANEIVKSQRKSNVFKRSLIGNDNEYFRKRQENVRRKDREDELESSSVKGVAKKQGNVVSRSTKGFLGRILDFFGVVLLGWFVNTLPNILKGLQKLIRMIQNVVSVLTGYIEGVKDFLVGMGQDIQNIFQSLPKIDLNQLKTDADKASEQVTGGLLKIRKELNSAVYDLNQPQNLGLNPNDPEGLIDLEPEEGKENQENKSGDSAPDQTPATGGTENIQPMSSNLNLSKPENQSDDIDKVVSRELNSDKFFNKLKSDEAQSQGETIGMKKFEELEEKDEGQDQKIIVDGINERLDSLVGGKAKREAQKPEMNDEQLVNKGKEQIKQVADKAKDLNPLKLAANLLNPFKRKNKNNAENVVPNTKNRSSLKRNRKRNQNTVVIVEKAVETPKNQLASTGGGGSGTMGLNNMNTNAEKDIVKKYSSLALKQ